MKVSTISTEVVLPASVQAVETRSGSGKPTPKTQAAQAREAATDTPPAAAVQAPLEMVINGQGLGLKFFYDRDAGVQVIQVVDEKTGEIIRQIPADEVVDFMRQFDETKGRFISLRS